MAVAHKTGTKINPGKWKHGPKPAVCPSCFILSHSQTPLNLAKGYQTLRNTASAELCAPGPKDVSGSAKYEDPNSHPKFYKWIPEADLLV